MRESSPNWYYEDRLNGVICGVDEAGRGPLAGPVVAAAVILDKKSAPKGLNDSKILSQTQRNALFDTITDIASFGIGIAEPEEIDRINVLGASMIAMQRAVRALPMSPDHALIDGNRAPVLNCNTQTIVKGDSKSLSIAAASILAKVTRDNLMVRADCRYPGYGFAKHKGYPTALHRAKLIELGACPIHRRSYAPVRATLL